MSKKGKKIFKKRYILYFVLFVIFVFFWSILIETNIVVVTKYKVEDEKLRGIRAVLAGDFHIKPYQENRLKYVIKKINAQNPDIVFLIGDYVNMHEDESSFPIAKIAERLAEIRPSNKVFTVLGNHDYYKDGRKIKKALSSHGITVLENQSRYVRVKDKLVCVSGIEDLITGFPNVNKALRYSVSPTIFLTHQPDIFYKVPEKVNLILAGHTHGGQINFPFYGSVIVPSIYGTRFDKGFFNENGRKMIVTKGIGTSILPVRFCCFPEIVVIDFI